MGGNSRKKKILFCLLMLLYVESAFFYYLWLDEQTYKKFIPSVTNRTTVQRHSKTFHFLRNQTWLEESLNRSLEKASHVKVSRPNVFKFIVVYQWSPNYGPLRFFIWPAELFLKNVYTYFEPQFDRIMSGTPQFQVFHLVLFFREHTKISGEK